MVRSHLGHISAGDARENDAVREIRRQHLAELAELRAAHAREIDAERQRNGALTVAMVDALKGSREAPRPSSREGCNELAARADCADLVCRSLQTRSFSNDYISRLHLPSSEVWHGAHDIWGIPIEPNKSLRQTSLLEIQAAFWILYWITSKAARGSLPTASGSETALNSEGICAHTVHHGILGAESYNER